MTYCHQCDRQRPICGQCIKSARTCGGFRDLTELVFRDETHKLRSRAFSSSRLRQNETLTYHGQVNQPPADYSLIRSPKLNAEQGLVDFFANNFTCRHTGTNLFWVPDNFDDILHEHSARCSVQCVGAMAMARLFRSSYFYRVAQKLYGTALLSLSEVWRQDIKIRSEATIVAILFLGFFEVLASDLSTSRQSWMAHLKGLGFVLNQHDEKIQDPVFLARMLMQSRSQVILNALQTKTAVPEQWQVPCRSMSWRFPPIVTQHNNANVLLTRLAALQGQSCSSQTIHLPFSDLVTLDEDMSQWMKSYTSSWRFIRRPSGLPSKFWWEMRDDQYQTPAMAHVLNNMRAARIIVYDLVQRANPSSLRPDAVSDRLLAYSTHQNTLAPPLMIQQMVSDICATIPLYYRPSYAIENRGGATESPPALGTTYWLFWPLEVVGAMESASVELTKWAKQCFERIFETTGILKAQLAAGRLGERIKHHDAPIEADPVSMESKQKGFVGPN